MTNNKTWLRQNKFRKALALLAAIETAMLKLSEPKQSSTGMI